MAWRGHKLEATSIIIIIIIIIILTTPVSNRLESIPLAVRPRPLTVPHFFLFFVVVVSGC